MEFDIIEIQKLFKSSKLDYELVDYKIMSGTTDGRVIQLITTNGSKLVLKFDHPNEIKIGADLLNLYQESSLLPKIIYLAHDWSHIIYTFIEGTTHFNRGDKKLWLIRLVDDLLNKYKPYTAEGSWGRLGYFRSSWMEFNVTSVEEAKNNIGNILSYEDYIFARSQVLKLYSDYSTEKYLLHGDTGVHNFVFNQSRLIGVIDPSPMAGPLIYDFIYAFCSSPDDIDLDTLLTAYNHLKQGLVDKERLIDEVSVQLYCRIGLSIKHHPNDLSEYLLAWKHWRDLCKQLEEGISIL